LSLIHILASALPILAPAPSAGELPALKLEFVAGGFTNPVAVTSAPNDATRLFVVEQDGKIRLVSGGVLASEPYLDRTGAVLKAGEEGLLNLAFHPDFANNGYLFVYYNDLAGDTVLSRFQAVPPSADTVDPATEVQILKLTQPFLKHNGGMLSFGPDGMLYLTTGDGGGTHDPLGNAQALDVLFGKVLRIDVDGGTPYAIPPDNPFVGVAGAREEIWAYGLRNPWRGGIDSASGAMLLGDVGAESLEEINAVTPGANFGWDCQQGDICEGQPGCTCPDPGFTPPLFTFDHSVACAIIGGPIYRGSQIPGFDGRAFFGDFCYGKVWSFAWDGATASDLVEHTSELSSTGSLGLVSTLGQDADGEVYVANLLPGEVHRIASADPEPDCDGDGTPDAVELASGTEFDVNDNLIPDSCELLLTANTFLPGQVGTLDFLGATPGDPVAFLWSYRGIGSGPCFYDGAWCLSLIQMSIPGMPIGVLGVKNADAEGATHASFTVPSVSMTTKVGMQAVVILFEHSKLSNPILQFIPPAQ